MTLQRLRKLLTFGNWPLRFKVLAGLLATALIPLIIFSLVNGTTRYQERLQTVGASLIHSAEIGAELIARDLARAQQDAYAISQDDLVKAQVTFFARSAYNNPDEELSASFQTRMRAVLQEVLVANPVYTSIRLLSLEGRLLTQFGNITDTPSLIDPEQGGYPALAQVENVVFTEAGAALLQPYADPQTGAPLIEIAIPVDDFGTRVGYLFFTLDMQRLINGPLQEGNTGPGVLFDTQYSYLLDAEGWLLASTENITPFSQQILLQDLPSGQTGSEPATYMRARGTARREVFTRHTVLEPLGWTVAAEMTVEDAMQPLALDLVASTVPTFFAVLLVTGLVLYAMTRQLVDPLAQLTESARQIAAGDLTLDIAAAQRTDEIGLLRNAVVTMTQTLNEAIEELEARVSERTRDLELATLIGREATGLQDIHTLLDNTINQIVKNFTHIYHAQVFLVDQEENYAELFVSTGEPGRELLRRGHRLGVGSVSVIGRVTELGQTVIARDASTSRVHRRNEFLPDTRAEMALPLVRGNRIIGALDVQSKEPDAFTPDEQNIFEALASQLAVAIDNARLFAATSRRAAEVEKLYQMLTRSNWQELLHLTRRQGYLDAAAGASEGEAATTWSEWQAEAAARGEPVISPPLPEGGQVLAVPILARGEVLGAVEWQLPEGAVNENTRLMAEQLTERLSTTLETVRLLERSEQLAQREQLLNQIGGQLMAEPTVRLILETAVRELAGVLRTPQVSIQLRPTNGQDPTPEHPVTESVS